MLENYKLYVENKTKVETAIDKDYLKNEASKVLEINNGIFLPPKKIADNNITGIYAGGVVDDNGKFIAGIERKTGRKDFNMACVEAYSFDNEKIVYNDEEVIFGGILLHIFGHVLIESLSRLWYVINNPNDKRKIVFLRYSTKCRAYDFFKLLGIEDRIIIVDEITKFKKIIIPEQSFVAWSYYKKEYITIFDAMKKNIEPKEFEKVYFTRTKLEKHDCINEEYFENFFKENGYKVISPEQISLEEQIAYLKGAKYFACTEGTLSHMALFCNDSINITILKRTNNYILTPQYMINQIKKLNVVLIDTTLNILPTTHYSNGIFLFIPSNNFIKFAQDFSMKYDLDYDMYNKVIEYLNTYIDMFTNKSKYNKYCDYDYFDILKYISSEVIKYNLPDRKEIKKNDLSKKELVVYYNENVLRNIKKKMKKVLKKLHLYDFAHSIYRKIRK